jgi:NAD+ kinase
MKCVGVLARPGLTEAGEALRELVRWLGQRGLHTLLDEGTAALADGLSAPGMSVVPPAEVTARADALVVLGGDGTLLAASHLVTRPVPVMGVNFGSLGFLTDITMTDLYPALEGVLAGNYRYEERRMLHAVVRRGGQADVSGDVLNDVVITKAALSRIIELDVSIDGVFVSSFRADGLIVSSPTGSTAYNLAAGGPIIAPGAEAISICPICPHTLTNRPLVLPFDVEIRLQMNTREQEVMLTADGQTGLPLMAGDRVEIRKSAKTFNTVCAKDRDYFEILRSKLRWSGR